MLIQRDLVPLEKSQLGYMIVLETLDQETLLEQDDDSVICLLPKVVEPTL
jgi:hypothetical protein